jgi:hypothetical protein
MVQVAQHEFSIAMLPQQDFVVCPSVTERKCPPQKCKAIVGCMATNDRTASKNKTVALFMGDIALINIFLQK